jgi:gamma-glutamyltranspeptidase
MSRRALQRRPAIVHVPVKRLISKRYAASLCSRISLGHVSGEPAAAGKAAVSVTTRERGDTVYLTAADRWGNMVSFIYSIYDYFGASVSIPGYGFPMNDRGSFFDLDPSSPSVTAPHKRPFLTIIPAFVMKDGKPLLAFGNMGGDEQAQAQATEIVNMVDLGMNVQAAGDAAASITARTPTASTSNRSSTPWSARSCGRWASRCGVFRGTTTCSAATRPSCSNGWPGTRRRNGRRPAIHR